VLGTRGASGGPAAAGWQPASQGKGRGTSDSTFSTELQTIWLDSTTMASLVRLLPSLMRISEGAARRLRLVPCSVSAESLTPPRSRSSGSSIDCGHPGRGNVWGRLWVEEGGMKEGR
jgi:hypothetical protein